LEVIYVNNNNRESYLSKNEPCVIALGFFDGVHLGHQQVIKTAKRVADENQLMLACMTFFPHPKEVLKKEKKAVQYLMPIAEKQRILRELGIKKFYIVQFDPEFASLTPKQFVKKYLIDFGVKYVVAGFDFTYGSYGEGHMDRMKDDSNDMLGVIKVEKVEFDGEKISSTLIRKLICSGKMELIPRYLGKDYQIEGKVSLKEEKVEVIVEAYYLLPPPGVYIVTVSNGKEAWKQEALVAHEANKLILSSNHRSLADTQYVYVGWVKRLPPAMFTPLEQLYFISEGIKS
jgi:riboflavin kinase/FMN adenylyltransferase